MFAAAMEDERADHGSDADVMMAVTRSEMERRAAEEADRIYSKRTFKEI